MAEGNTKKDTARKKAYLKYQKSKGKKAMTYGQWQKSKTMGRGASSLSRNDYVALSRMRKKK